MQYFLFFYIYFFRLHVYNILTFERKLLMFFYKKDNIEISLIEEENIDAVLKIFNSFDFNVSLDTGVRPSTSKFENTIRTSLALEKKYDAVLVLKKDGNVIGYF